MQSKFCVLFLFFMAFSVHTQAQDWGSWGEDEEEVDSLALDPDDSLDVAEICFRDMFKTNKGVRRNKYFAIGWEHMAQHRYIDPDDPFMARFSDVRPRVKKLSQYYDNLKKMEGTTLLMYMGEIEQVGKHKIIVHCGYWESDKIGAGHYYTVEFVDGVWQITQSMIEWEL